MYKHIKLYLNLVNGNVNRYVAITIYVAIRMYVCKRIRM